MNPFGSNQPQQSIPTQWAYGFTYASGPPSNAGQNPPQLQQISGPVSFPQPMSVGMNLQPANQQPMQLVPILQQHPQQAFHGQFVQSFPQGPIQGPQSFTLAPAVPQQGTLWSMPQPPPGQFAMHNSIPMGATVVQQAPQQPQQQPQQPNWALPGVVHHPQRGGPGNAQGGMAPLAPIQPSQTAAPSTNANLSGEDLNNYTNLFVAHSQSPFETMICCECSLLSGPPTHQ
jgi:hypothetical protein